MNYHPRLLKNTTPKNTVLVKEMSAVQVNSGLPVHHHLVGFLPVLIVTVGADVRV